MLDERLSTSPKEYFPKIYDHVLEMQQLSNAESRLFSIALAKLDSLWANQFILTSDEIGITQYENVLGITSDPTTESLEFRRLRVLNRYTATPPYSMNWLSNKLDELLGAGAWTYEMDYANRTLYVEATVANKAWSQEISVTITSVKPANLVFIMRPLIASAIHVSEMVSTAKRSNNYRLGVSWVLGSTPFTSVTGEEELLMAGVATIQDGMLNSLAKFTVDDIGYAIINDTFRINKADFVSLAVDANKVILQYSVPASEGLGVVTNSKLYNSEGVLLEEANIYVDNAYDVVLKHTFTFKEGE